MSRIKKSIKNETGLATVEGAIIFPLMFFILLFILYIGNMYYEQAKIDSIVMKYAVIGAECIADPFHYDIENTQKLPIDVKSVDLQPYRYIFGGSFDKIESDLSAKLKAELKDGSIFFRDSKLSIIGTENSNGKYIQYNNSFFYSSVTAQVSYTVSIPIGSFIAEDLTLFKLSSRAEVTVNDAPEFIRNTDFAYNLISRTKVGQTIGGVFQKVADFIEKFAKK